MQPAAQAAHCHQAFMRNTEHRLDEGSTPTLLGLDDQHENTGARLLHALWGADVAEPVRFQAGP